MQIDFFMGHSLVPAQGTPDLLSRGDVTFLCSGALSELIRTLCITCIGSNFKTFNLSEYNFIAKRFKSRYF
jgi:hypothetical protein